MLSFLHERQAKGEEVHSVICPYTVCFVHYVLRHFASAEQTHHPVPAERSNLSR